MNVILNNLQLVVVLLVLSFSALGYVVRRFKEYRLKKQHEQNLKLAHIERLRTGRTLENEGEMGIDAPPDPRQARAAEIAARRQAQLEELRRRRQGGAEIEVAPGMVIRIPGSSGPIVPGTRPPPQRQAPPQRPAGRGVAFPVPANEQTAEAKRREIEEKRRAAQQRQREAQEKQQRDLDRQRQAQEKQRRTQEQRRQAAREKSERGESAGPAHAAAARGTIGGAPWDEDKDQGESTTHRIVSDVKPGDPRAGARSPLAALIAGSGGWKRAIVLQEVLGRPVADRDQGSGVG